MTKARVNADNASADIQGVTAGTGLSGGGTSGTVTLTNGMATAIDAKGDLVVGTGADTFDRLAAGSTGDTIVADSSTSTGLRYQSAYNGNAVINGAFDIWQRGTSIASGAFYPYTADRWQCVRGGVVAGMTVSRQSSGLTSFQYCARLQRDSGNTSTAGLSIVNSFESSMSYQFAGQAVTFSFYARAGANYSGGAISAVVTTGTGTDQNGITASYTGSTSPISFTTATPTTTWTRYQGTGTFSSSATELFINLSWTPTGTAGTNDYIEITGVQLELGSIATTFKRAGGTIQGELAACQRYFCKLAGVNPYGGLGAGFLDSATVAKCFAIFPVQMRTTPSATSVGTAWLAQLHGAATFSSISNPTNNGTEMLFAITGGVTGRGTLISSNNDANVVMTFSAEL